ncbi:exonuclease domain-containing protein [Streptomyces sp. NPDC055692]|uniref:exonuclease domain-containing protein n=1 Tax=Streptomyces sp. NPDC055692 TaxID=3155683 RepID=UPI00342D7803
MRKKWTWLDRPLVGFDTETTGVNVDEDRIVSASVVRWGGGQVTEARNWLSDVGGMEIPAEATAVHGITSEQARAAGRPAAAVIEEIIAALAASSDAGLPIVAMNAQFDVTLLEREADRYGLRRLFVRSVPRVLDPRVLDKHVTPYRKGKRNLAALCTYWCVKLDGAHNAEADAKAACSVVSKIARRFPWLTSVDLGDLHERQVQWARAQTADFRSYLARVSGSVDMTPFDWPVLPAPASTEDLAAAARFLGTGRPPGPDPTEAFTAGEADVAEIRHCPAEGRETAHAVSIDGARRCWSCDHTTAGTS